ncbi:MAG: cyclic lactone autoinducer peptide [Lachnospiraceae bacterium]|nr:cyclic lactone autoinducer peptide [Lachnospiraceae bacterium]
MKKTNKKPIVADALVSLAQRSLSSAANSRCAYVFHQPKQPENVKKYRKF